jgi:hypothetical protein
MNNSECCDAPLLNYNDGLGICADCKEWAGQIKEEPTETKYMEIISTFWVNKASIAFRPTLMALIRSETHSKALQQTIAKKTYEDSAAEYYARHGTVGEF